MKNLRLHFCHKTFHKIYFTQKLLVMIILLLSAHLQARELIEINQSFIGEPQIQNTSINTGIPPIKLADMLWINSFGYQKWALPQTELIQYRWSLGLTKKINEKQGLAVFIPLQINSDENSLNIRGNSFFSILIATINQQESEYFSWSYGFIVTDQANGRRPFPAVGLRTKSKDGLWKFNLGFPAISLSYLGLENTEASLIASRDSTPFHLVQNDINRSDVRYKEVTLNSLALQYKRKFKTGLSLSARYSYLFSSGVYNLGEDFRRINTEQSFHEQNQITLTLGIGFPEDIK